MIDEFEPRRSGLPIPTRSSGFSDKAETDLPNTNLIIGAPSADAAYIEDKDGGSLYSLYIHDRLGPQSFDGYENAIPFSPISTMRTTPYAFVVPEMQQSPTENFVIIRWSAQALQLNRTGLALYLNVEDVEIPRPGSPLFVPAPSGSPLVSFGGEGTLLVDQNGDGELESTGISYHQSQAHRFLIKIIATPIHTNCISMRN